ncbi:unnamed protein product [Agarophyton chilense]
MMAMLGQWLGFDGSSSCSSSSCVKQERKTTTRTTSMGSSSNKQTALCIHSSASSSSCSAQGGAHTKSDELLRDFELMRFLCDVDQRLKEDEQLLPVGDVQRLEALHAQASMDGCGALADIVEHLEEAHERLRHRLAVSSPNSAANDALRAAWMTVF